MMKNYSDRLIKAIRTTALASHYLAHIPDLNPCWVILFIRVSGRGQKEHLAHVESLLRRELERRGFKVVGVFKEIATGSSDDRTTLELAILEAERLGAILVAESANRFIRHPEFHPQTNPDRLPSVFDFERLMVMAGNVKLATLHHPDTHWKAVLGFQSKRGQQGSGNYGGRPSRRGPGWAKARRLKLLPVALARRKKGRSYRRIGRELEIHWSTIRDWIKQKTAHPASAG